MSDTDKRDLPPEALRALAEAEERRKNARPLDLPKEYGGRDGPEPVRYGDYEKKGIAVVQDNPFSMIRRLIEHPQGHSACPE